MNDSAEVTQESLLQKPVKAVLSMLPCLLFLYVNVVMLFSLLRKPLLLECPRYILFVHLLLSDTLHLLVSMLLYILTVTMVKMISYICVIITMLAVIPTKLSPLNLAVMSLERYVAICFPLRHGDIVTTRKTGVAIAVMWTVASLESFTQIVLFVSLEDRGLIMPRLCHIHIFQLKIFSSVNMAFTIVYFASVSIIIIYTYIATLIAAYSNVLNASKAHKTVLLHLFQFCLCLISTLFGVINSSSLEDMNHVMGLHIQYVLFLGLIIFPKCLSPLIYGLRDNTFRQVFKYYFTFGFKTTGTVFPKS